MEKDTPSLRKHTKSLLRAAKAVLSYESFEKSARVIFNEARNLTGAKSGYIALLSENGEENEVLFLESGGLECVVDPSLPMPIRGLRAECYESKNPVYENSFMESKWVSFMPEGHVILKNVLFSPLIINSKVEGVMGLANKPSDFGEEDAELAVAFGEFAAIALNNSYNLDKLRKTIDKLEKTQKELANEKKKIKKHKEGLEKAVEKRTQQLMETKNMLLRANNVKSNFLSNMSHELRTPLAGILGFSQILQEEAQNLSKNQMEMINDIQLNGNKLLRHIDKMLLFSDLESGFEELNYSDYNLENCIQSVLDLFQFDIDKKNLKFCLENNYGEEYISGDRQIVQQIIMQLLDNAIKFTPNGKKIGIRTLKKENWLIIETWDEGPGIEKKDLDLIYKVFEQIEKPFSKRYEGIGIGLNLVEYLVRLHKGKIEAKSSPGKGTLFRIKIPPQQ